MAAAANFGRHSNHSFMSCILKVNTRASGWQRAVRKVLNSIHGVHNFRMDEDGIVAVSGMVDPFLLLKMIGKAGKRAEICWLKFGDCSSNLYAPPMPFPSSNSVDDHINYDHRNNTHDAYAAAGYGGHGYYGYNGGDHGHRGYGGHGYVDPYYYGYGGRGYYGDDYWNHHGPPAAGQYSYRPFGGYPHWPLLPGYAV